MHIRGQGDNLRPSRFIIGMMCTLEDKETILGSRFIIGMMCTLADKETISDLVDSL